MDYSERPRVRTAQDDVEFYREAAARATVRADAHARENRRLRRALDSARKEAEGRRAHGERLQEELDAARAYAADFVVPDRPRKGGDRHAEVQVNPGAGGDVERVCGWCARYGVGGRQ